MAIEPSSEGWAASYSQYLSRSAAISARTLSLYQEVLERVARGTLPPTVFQDRFPIFAAAHGAEFTSRLAAVGARFLSDFVRLCTRLAQQPSGLDLAAEPAIAPPQFDASNPARWYEQLAEYAGALNARAMTAYRVQLDRVAAGDTTPSEVQQRTAQQMARQLPDFMQLMSALYWDMLNGLNEVRSAYEETYFRGVLAAARPEDGDAAVRLTLAGPVGSTVTASFSVTNTTAERARIGHHLADMWRVDGGGPSLVPEVTFVPDLLELGPGEEGTLTLALRLDPERYDADALYAGTLKLHGASDMPLEIELRVLATRNGQAA